jgi:hypothetical protein
VRRFPRRGAKFSAGQSPRHFPDAPDERDDECEVLRLADIAVVSLADSNGGFLAVMLYAADHAVEE